MKNTATNYALALPHHCESARDNAATLVTPASNEQTGPHKLPETPVTGRRPCGIDSKSKSIIPHFFLLAFLHCLLVAVLDCSAQETITGLNLVINGNFEQGPVIPPSPKHLMQLLSGDTSIPGWVVTKGSIDYVGNYWQHADGSRSLDLSGFSAGAVSQSIATLPGRNYRLTFDLSGEPFSTPPPTKHLKVHILGSQKDLVSPEDFSFDTTRGTTLASMGWVVKTIDFVADSSSTTVIFESLDEGYAGPALDNVSVVALSGPETTPAIQDIELYPGLTLTGAVNSVVAIETVSKLSSTDWTHLTNVVIPSSPYVWMDTAQPGAGIRFYRTATPTNTWVGLDISTAAHYAIFSSSSQAASYSFTFNGGSFATSSWLRKYGFSEPGVPDDGWLPIPGVTNGGYFRIYLPQAIVLSGPRGRQPALVTARLPLGQQQHYSRLAVLHGNCWGNGVVRVTLHYDDGNDAVVNLSVVDWSVSPSSAPAALTQAATSRDTHPQFGNTCYIYSQTAPLDSTRSLISVSFAVATTPSGDAESLFTVGILGLSALR